MPSARPRAFVALFVFAAAFVLSLRFSPAPSGGSPLSPATPRGATTAQPLAPSDSASSSTLADARADSLARLAYAQGWSGPLPEPMAAFRAWTQRYLTAPSSAARLALTAEGVALARARRPVLRDLIINDPARALVVTVPAAVRASLPAAVLAELETRHAGRGEFALQAAQPAPGDRLTGPALRRIVFLAGVTYTARPYGRREAQFTKEGASLHGIALDSEFALHESPLRLLEAGESPSALAEPAARCFGCLLPAEPALADSPEANVSALEWIEFDGAVRRVHAADLAPLEQRTLSAEDHSGPRVAPLTLELPSVPSDPVAPPTAPAAPTPHTVGVKQVLVIRVDFSDFPGEPLSAAAAQGVLDNAVGPYLDNASYGLTSLVTTVSSELYRLPRTGASYATAGDSSGLHADARTAAGAHHNVSTFDRIIVLFPNIGSSRVTGSRLTFAGLANVVGTNAWINGPNSFVLATVSHELGHTYGLLHANLWRAKNSDAVSPDGTTLEYGDPFDMMGSTSVTGVTRDSRHHYNMWAKNLLGWLPDSAVTTVARSGTYRIHRFDARSAPRDRPLALRVFRDGVRWYWIGLRQNFLPAGSPRTNGAYVVWGYNQRLQTQLLDLTTPGTAATDAALPLGTTFTDAPYGVSIKPIATGGTEPEQWLDVEITVPATTPPNVVTAWGRLNATFFDTETGDDVSPNPEVNVPMDLRNVQALAAGEQHALALRPDGTVVAWGNHTDGQIAVPAGLTDVVSVAAGGHVSGVVRRDGTVRLWGIATGGVTTPPAGLTGVRQLAIGGLNSVGLYHALALKTDGTLVAWGDNSRSQATIPAGLTNVIAVAASDRLSVALRADGTVVRWGTTFTGGVVFPTGLADVTAIASNGGAQHALALKRDGTVVAWGANGSGQCNVPAGLANVIAVATGAAHSLALKSDGTIVAWGRNTSNQTNVPPALPRIVALAASSAGSFALSGVAFQIVTQPAAQVAALGASATLSINATASGALAYQWFRDGVALPGATAATYTLARAAATDAGAYTVAITHGAATLTSAAATLTVSPVTAPPTDPGRLINLSILTALTGPTDNFTFGVVVGGADTRGPKPLLVRAVGPSLTALGVTGVLEDPKLEFFTGAAPVGENDNWGGAAVASAVFAQVGAFPFTGPTSRDAALSLPALASGANSAKISGTGAGTVIAELYDATPPNAFTTTTPRLINVSVLKHIGTGVTAGFVIGGSTPRSVLIRAIGPTLGGFGVGGTVADPRLALFSGQTQIGANDNWGGTPALGAAFVQVGAFTLAPDSRDAALLQTLAPGPYTVQVTSTDAATSGTALVEVYEVP